MTRRRRLVVRRAAHAGTWYSDDARILSNQMDDWVRRGRVLARAKLDGKRVRAIIVPHAGFRYSGSVAGAAYAALDDGDALTGVRRIFVLGPSHHYDTGGRCMLSGCAAYATPLGALQVDRVACRRLQKTGLFGIMAARVDEAEHSLEMQLPFIARAIQRVRSGARTDCTIVPILVGALNADAQKRYGQVLAPHVANCENIFVVSSDF